MSIEIKDMNITNLSEVAETINNSYDKDALLTLLSDLKGHLDAKDISALQAGSLLSEIEKRLAHISNDDELSNIYGGRTIAHKPVNKSVISSRVGAVTLGLLISSMMGTVIMYTLLFLAKFIK